MGPRFGGLGDSLACLYRNPDAIMKVTIETCENGWIVTGDTTNVIEEQVNGSSCLVKPIVHLFYFILNELDLRGSKHDEHRITIQCHNDKCQ